MVKRVFKAIVLSIIVMLIAGFAFPAIASLITEETLPFYSNGHPVTVDNKVVDSYLLAEAFNNSVFFQPRPSAINYNLSCSGAYSYSLTNPEVYNITKNDLKRFAEYNHVNESKIPSAMVSYSGSGLDPSIPLNGAELQVNRIANAIYNMAKNKSVDLNISSIKAFLLNIINRDKRMNFPIFGTYYVNVVRLNFDIIYYLMDKHIINNSFLE
ncbi:potassium-transporting ATPase subunit KdpC [Picrophilus oshimae]|uniref:Potassium-transporting ATPase KdpC subunit n=1 Tax=Picrophilus torridus (strain ATCC 700027 / DSM 9790 / JCM 10055 / NBRC 100828 / KAW 2/3) TaxID=1122961 RepID=A0A8G2L7W1_PICTO|nr:potassium-transporting ATPase subunit KdpC [Picrophilus oshimae]SMD31528.1 K+-transporting ATPase ATPase C chain [Picrophilus oshimae DSM 9789]